MRFLAIALTALLAITGIGRAETIPFSYSFMVSTETYGGRYEDPRDGMKTLRYSRDADGSGYTLDTRMGTAVFRAGGGEWSGGVADAILPVGTLTFDPHEPDPSGYYHFEAYTRLTLTVQAGGKTSAGPVDMEVEGRINANYADDALYGGASGAWFNAGGHTYRLRAVSGYITLDGTTTYSMRLTVEPETDLTGWGYQLVTQVPEPSSFALLAVGGLGLLGWRRRRRPS